MGFKINTEIKALNESELKLMSQSELENSLKRLNDTLKDQYVSKGLDEGEDINANNITEEVIAKLNNASVLI